MAKDQTILVIEDEEVLRSTLVETLRRSGYETLEAKDGKEGFEIALKNRPDLILLDLILPIMSGVDSLKKIRRDTWGKSVPVIILTNLSATDEQLIRDMVEERPDYYLIKSSWKMQDIVDQIKKVLSK